MAEVSRLLEFGRKRLPESWLSAFNGWSWAQQDHFFTTLYYMRLGEAVSRNMEKEEAHKYAWDTTMEALNYPHTRDTTAIFRFGLAIKRPLPGGCPRYY